MDFTHLVRMRIHIYIKKYCTKNGVIWVHVWCFLEQLIMEMMMQCLYGTLSASSYSQASSVLPHLCVNLHDRRNAVLSRSVRQWA